MEGENTQHTHTHTKKGLINTHHHLYQNLTRAIATGPGKKLFDWLEMLLPIWQHIDAEAVYVSAKLGKKKT